jgi:hypothetical protein
MFNHMEFLALHRPGHHDMDVLKKAYKAAMKAGLLKSSV